MLVQMTDDTVRLRGLGYHLHRRRRVVGLGQTLTDTVIPTVAATPAVVHTLVPIPQPSSWERFESKLDAICETPQTLS